MKGRGALWTRRDLLAAGCFLVPAGLSRAAENSVVLPALLNDFHQIWIPARINGSPVLWCELDSGGGGPLFFIDAEKALMIGVRAERLGLSAGVAQGQPLPDGRAHVTVDFPGLHLEQQELVIKPTPLGKDGIVALANFRQWVTEMDYQTPAVRLHDAATFRYDGPGEAIPLTIDQTNPLAEVRLRLGPQDAPSDEIRGRFVVDTGAAGSIAYLSNSFAERMRLAERNLRWVPDSMGVSATRIARFGVGTYNVDSAVIRRFPARGFGGTAEPDGLLGVEFLRRFRLFFDYGRERLILEPNPAYREPSRFDASGLRVYKQAADQRGLKIFLVVPGTPAAEAGVQENDVLLGVDHVSVDLISAGQVAEMLMQAGAERNLLLQRGAQVLTVRVKLRRLL
jgi:PDZ domain